MPQAYSALKNAYDNPLLRLNTAQVEASEWLRNNIDENQNASVIGPPGELLQKVWWMASYSHRTSFFFEGFLKWKTYAENREEIVRYHLLNDYIVVDYTDVSLISDRSFVENLQEFEKNNLQNHTLLYNKNGVKVYKYKA